MSQAAAERPSEVIRLRDAIRRHRLSLRPSQRREADETLYRALGPERGRPTFHVCPPSAYLETERSYYDSPY